MSENFNPFGDEQQPFLPPKMPTQGQEKMLLVVFVIDNSRTMEGAPIAAVNSALMETISSLKEFSDNNPVNLQIAIMTFTDHAEWLQPCERLTKDFYIRTIDVQAGYTNYSAAYTLLNEAMSKSGLMNYSAAPAIIFMTDGKPDDELLLESKMEQLKQNGYFLQSVRSAILVGDAAQSPEARKYMTAFTGSEKRVYDSPNPSDIINTLELATIHTVIGGGNDDENVPPEPPTPPVDPVWPGNPPFSGFPPVEPGPSPIPFPGNDSSNPYPGTDPVAPVNPFPVNDSSIPFLGTDPVAPVNPFPDGNDTPLMPVTKSDNPLDVPSFPGVTGNTDADIYTENMPLPDTFDDLFGKTYDTDDGIPD